MSVGYVAVQWTPPKKVYDAIVAAGVVAYLAIFIIVGKLLFRAENALSDEVLALRALGSCAIVMLHIILMIGPLARLDRRFIPLLYNRRHLGVATFLVALCHGALAIGYYHGFGDINPLLSLLTSNTNFASLRAFPFQILGAGALLIMFLLASTSHDFWNRNLGAGVWKALHMLVYVAYALLVAHVTLGALQTDRGIVAPVLVCCGAVLVIALHWAAGGRERARDVSTPAHAASNSDGGEWIDVCGVDELTEKRGKAVCLPGLERVAVFRYDGQISVVTNLCVHQGGPLGEGRIVDGCITCPWHGWTYRPADGCSPPPFTERIPTYRVRLDAGRVLVNPHPLPAGTIVEPARISENAI